jgi:hypothetical protein
MRILFFPIEPLEDRYSADWFKWFTEAFKKENIENYQFLPQPLSDKINDGSFLDVCGTNYFKAMQIAQFSEMAYNKQIKDDDVVFLMDAWFPGLESIAYIRDALKLKFKICGILHAGTYDPYDFLTKSGMSYWGKSLEESWFKILDKVFVATNYHKRLLMSTRDIDSNKIIVTGIPAALDLDYFGPKENIVVFPHRLDSEKNPQMFLELARRNTDSNWSFVCTKEVCKTKQEYYDLLKRSKIAVSFADQETFGIAMVEAVMLGCLPAVPDRLSYSELYDPVFQYSSYNEAVKLINNMKDSYDAYQDDFITQKRYLRIKCQQAIHVMIHEMRRL